MAKVCTYLNFARETEKAFNFYKSVFGGEFTAPIARFADMPPQEGTPPLPQAERQLVMHVELPIPGGHLLRGSDAPESMGFKVKQGNNVYINLELDTRPETDRLFKALSDGGEVEMPMQDMFWGDYFGSFADRFGIKWMLICSGKKGGK